MELGESHPDYLLAKLDSQQISDWIAYFNIHPFGDMRDDIRFATIARTIAAQYMGKDTPTLSEFMLPDIIKSNKKQAQKEMIAQLKAWSERSKAQQPKKRKITKKAE